MNDGRWTTVRGPASIFPFSSFILFHMAATFSKYLANAAIPPEACCQS